LGGVEFVEIAIYECIDTQFESGSGGYQSDLSFMIKINAFEDFLSRFGAAHELVEFFLVEEPTAPQAVNEKGGGHFGVAGMGEVHHL
jgi:hypothetical protein